MWTHEQPSSSVCSLWQLELDSGSKRKAKLVLFHLLSFPPAHLIVSRSWKPQGNLGLYSSCQVMLFKKKSNNKDQRHRCHHLQGIKGSREQPLGLTEASWEMCPTPRWSFLQWVNSFCLLHLRGSSVHSSLDATVLKRMDLDGQDTQDDSNPERQKLCFHSGADVCALCMCTHDVHVCVKPWKTARKAAETGH